MEVDVSTEDGKQKSGRVVGLNISTDTDESLCIRSFSPEKDHSGESIIDPMYSN